MRGLWGAFVTYCNISCFFQEQKKELTAENIMLWEKITELSSRGILKIVDFAKKIPGFLTLPTSDQITLLKAACLEIMVSLLCRQVANSLYESKTLCVLRFLVAICQSYLKT